MILEIIRNTFQPVEKSLFHQGLYIMNVFFSHTGYMHNLTCNAILHLVYADFTSSKRRSDRMNLLGI